MLNGPLNKHAEKPKRIRPRTIIAFFLMMAVCFLLVFAMVINRCRVENLTMEQLIMEKSIKVNDTISKLLYKTQILSSIILQTGGKIKDFNQVATTIVDDPAILNILIAPDGVVSDVYPLEGNEAVIGLDFFAEGAGNKEAVMAKETGALVLGGPFDAVQGGQILVGRLPVFLAEPDGTERFWGLVSVTLKYPAALDGAGLNELEARGFAYEVWRISPDNGEKQIISSSGHNYKKNTNYVERTLSIANAEWYFRILPVRSWSEFPETWVAIFISVGICFLIAAVMQNNYDLKRIKGVLEAMSNTDPLTGIHNRRYFVEYASKLMDRVVRLNSRSYIIMLDLDHFKEINDKYGHRSGDMVLKEIAARISKILRPYDMFARYGGEEFIGFVDDIDKASVMRLAERIRTVIEGTPIKIKGGKISVTASIGIATAAPENDLNTAIDSADEALYAAKRTGRNKCIFYSDDMESAT